MKVLEKKREKDLPGSPSGRPSPPGHPLLSSSSPSSQSSSVPSADVVVASSLPALPVPGPSSDATGWPRDPSLLFIAPWSLSSSLAPPRAPPERSRHRRSPLPHPELHYRPLSMARAFASSAPSSSLTHATAGAPQRHPRRLHHCFYPAIIVVDSVGILDLRVSSPVPSSSPRPS